MSSTPSTISKPAVPQYKSQITQDVINKWIAYYIDISPVTNFACNDEGIWEDPRLERLELDLIDGMMELQVKFDYGDLMRELFMDKLIETLKGEKQNTPQQ
jgi:hypothetical protein